MTHTRKAWKNVTLLDHPEGFTMGPINAETWLRDPKHMGFMLARYKFAAKMLRRSSSILEIGCGEGLGAMILLRDTGASYLGVDFDPAQISYAQAQVAPHGEGRLAFAVADAAAPDAGPAGAKGRFDGLVCLDVIEHVDPREEAGFLDHCLGSLAPGGVAVIGTPNSVTDAFASPPSRAGHVNLFDAERFTRTLDQRFAQVFLFSMNDEMIHTGFARMAHYFMALCVK